jgi:hypothetical protein
LVRLVEADAVEGKLVLRVEEVGTAATAREVGAKRFSGRSRPSRSGRSRKHR